ncbi:MAG TPA: ATP-binding protein [Sphingomonas sp.]|nr:ATP-binding protein [Sphingomonas sp.]
MHSRANRAPRGGRIFLIAGSAASVVLLSTWAVALRQVRYEQSAAVRAAVSQNEDRALMLQQYVSRTLENANLVALHVADLVSTGRFDLRSASRDGLVAGEMARDRSLLSVNLFDARGVLVDTTGHNVRAGVTVDNLALQETGDAQPGGLVVSKPVYSPQHGRQVIWLSRRLNGRDGSVAGLVAMELDPAQLTAIYGQATVKPSEAAWVVGLDGVIRSRVTGANASSGEDVSHGATFAVQRRTEKGSFIGPGTLDGRIRLVSHRRVPGYPLLASYSILEQEVLAAPRRRALVMISGAVLVSLLTLLLSFVLVRAIRRREQRALELAAAKARLEEAQRIARVGDWSYSIADRRVSWSPQLFEMYERDPALGPMGEEFLALLPEESVRRNREAIKRVVEAGVATSWDLTVRLPSGRIRIHRMAAVPTRDEMGAIIGFHGATQDVTESRNYEILQQELAHYARVGALNALAGTLSHELTQPLAAASNYLAAAGFVAKSVDGEPATKLSGMLDEAGKQVRRAGEIIQRMRKLVAKEANTREVASLEDLVREAVATLAITTCPDIAVSRETADELLVCCDGVQIQQVILNLVRNACEAQRGANVPAPMIHLSCVGRMATVSVSDHGPGFPDAFLARLSEPFLSSKDSGLGLGLSISRTIVEAHGGALKAANRPEGGAIVSFTLPIHTRVPQDALA